MGLVQSISASQVAGTTTLALTFPSAPKTGNTLIAVGSSTVTTDTLTLSDGVNTYTTRPSILNAATSTMVSRLFFVVNATGGTSTLTLGGIALTAVSTLAIHEFSTITAFDTANAGASGTGNNIDSGLLSITHSSEILFGYMTASIVGSLSFATSFNQAELVNNATNGVALLTAWINASSANDFTALCTPSKGGTLNWASQAAGFVIPAVNTSHAYLRRERG